MSSFTANSQIYNVVTENELAEVLSHYNSEFVFSIVDEAMRARFLGSPVIKMPNVVGAWESNFKAIITQYGESSKEYVLKVRNETYEEIIDYICKEFLINFTIDDSVDLYTAAYHLYELFVCDFTTSITNFFANYIYKERANIYDAFGLAELKKNKDSSTAYGKKIYKDIKLAVINANINFVISQVSSMDIPFYNVISNIYGNNSDIKKYIMSIISSDDGFFDRVFGTVLNSEVRPEIVTNIRFKLQELAMMHDQIATSDITSPNQADAAIDDN